MVPRGLGRPFISISRLKPLEWTISNNALLLYEKRGISRSTQLAAKKSSITAGHNNATSSTISRTLPTAKDVGYQSFAKILAGRSSPTLLYEASSSTGHTIRVYLVGLFCIAYGAHQFYSVYLFPPPDFPYILGVFSTGASFLVAFFGLYVLFGVSQFALSIMILTDTVQAYRVVRSITAIPPKSGPLLLKIDSASLFFMFRPRSVTVPHYNVTMSDPLYIPEVKLSPLELAQKRQKEVQMREKERSRILTLPFRQASYWTWRGFRAMKPVFFGYGFTQLDVKGKNRHWKLNPDAAWALDNGRALDRLTEKKFT